MEIFERFQRGETLLIPIDLIDGDVAEVASVAANAKRARYGAVPAASEPEAFDWAVTPRAAAGEVAAGWDLTLSAEASAALVPGRYCTTIELVLAGGGRKRAAPLFFAIDEVTL